jgi:hypothetical protein
MASGSFKSEAVILKITGTNTQQTINIDFASYDGSNAGIDDAFLLAFLIPDPTSADIQYAETLAQATDTLNPTIAQTLTFSPSSAGDYIWLANGFEHEPPGGSTNGGLSAIDEAAAIQQSTEESYITSGTDGFVPMVHFERRTLTTGSKSFIIRHQPDTTSGSHRQGLTQILFRADVFEGVEVADAASSSQTTSTTYTNKVSLTTATQASARDYVYLVVTMVDSDAQPADRTISEYGLVQLAGANQLEEDPALLRGSYNHQIAWAYAENTTGNRVVRTRYRTENAGLAVQAQYAHAIALRYKEPGASLGSEQTNSVAITVRVHHTNTSGGDAQLITSASATITSATADPLNLDLGSGLQQTFTAADPRLLRVEIEVTAVSGSGSFTLDYDGTCATNRCSNLNTPVVVVPEAAVALAAVGILIPLVTAGAWRRKRLAERARQANAPFARRAAGSVKAPSRHAGRDPDRLDRGAHRHPRT